MKLIKTEQDMIIRMVLKYQVECDDCDMMASCELQHDAKRWMEKHQQDTNHSSFTLLKAVDQD